MSEHECRLSLVVPMYNRADTIERCLASVIAQDFRDWEVVLIDDGSTDDSIARAQTLPDPRIRLIRHPHNIGVGTARNRGVAESRAEWVVFFDSDDELVPGALARMAELVREAPATIHALWFRCLMDNGVISPTQMPAKTEWGYVEYLEFIEQTAHLPRDMIRCVRRECFEHVAYPTTRLLGTKYHLDFARRYRSRIYPDVLRLYHLDAGNRLAPQGKRLDRLSGVSAAEAEAQRKFLRDSAEGFDALIREHGEALRAHAPHMYVDYLRRAAVASIRAGNRGNGRQHARSLVRARPWSFKSWSVLLAGYAARGAPAS